MEIAKSVFTPNYNFYSRQACASNTVAPGRQAADNLRVSSLEVGKEYSYCVRATGRSYMQNPLGPSKGLLTSSNEACAMHRVRWEGSISGKVTLPPDSGSLPVEGVAITWEMKNTTDNTAIASGADKTGAGGGFSIVLNLDNPYLSNEVEYPILVKMAKTTGAGDSVIPHTFACNYETISKYCRCALSSPSTTSNMTYTHFRQTVLILASLFT